MNTRYIYVGVDIGSGDELIRSVWYNGKLMKQYKESTMTPKVTLVNVTQDALEMLILAKSTRLEMSPALIDRIFNMSAEDKMKEVEYIANTIPSSWEFLDFIFLICDVTRAYTHQQVRTRTASYAQQAMRIADMSKMFKYSTGPTIDNDPQLKDQYEAGMHFIRTTYQWLVEHGAKIEDARGLLPTNIGTNILVKMNLRTLADVCRKRSSSRVQDEYREVVRQMKSEALSTLPWVMHFIDRTFDRAASDLDQSINNLLAEGRITIEEKMRMVKLLDQMRMQS